MEEQRVTRLFKNSAPSVLGISLRPPREGASLAERAREVVGSGFVWDDTHIVTSLRVIDAASATPFVTVFEAGAQGEEHRTSFPAAAVGADPLSRIAVLRVDGAPPGLMKPLRVGKSGDLRVGQDVFAIGNPYGLEHSLTRGVVSGVGRRIPGTHGVGGVIQIDASLSPGFSGGPLLDSSGAVVGVNAAAVPGGIFAGMGLAIPMETVSRRVADVIDKGFVSRPWLGAMFAEDGVTKEIGVEGAMVLQVVSGGPAALAGLRPTHGGVLGDVVVELAGSRVDSKEAMLDALAEAVPGDVVSMSVLRPTELVAEPAVLQTVANTQEGIADAVQEVGFEKLELQVKLGTSASRLVLK